jgi:hypothetical protein
MCITQEQLEKHIEMLRLWIQEDIRRIFEEVLSAQRESFNTDVVRHMSVLAGEYQWRLAVVSEKVDTTWEKCEREHGVFEQKEMTLAEKVALLEEYLPTYPRNHKGKAQSSRNNNQKNIKNKQKKKDKGNINRK